MAIIPLIIPTATWYNTDDSDTCDFCKELIGSLQGKRFIVGSPAYFDNMGTFHPNCRWWYSYGVIPAGVITTQPERVDVLPPDNPAWDIAHKSIVPLQVWPHKIDRIAARGIKRKQGAIQEGTDKYDLELVQKAKQEIRRLTKQGELTEKQRDRLIRKYGINYFVAFNEVVI